MKAIVKVPGTSANIGPGFDTLGCAWNVYNCLTFEETGNTLEITGCDPKYAGPDNLAYTSYVRAMEYMGLPAPQGLKIDIRGDVPVSRGLGSSANMIVGGIAGASALHGNKMSKRDMLNLATDIEGHPDNVCPAIFGSLVSSVKNGDTVVKATFDISAYLRFTLFIPDFELETKMARGILPKTYSKEDAVFNIGRLPVLLAGLENSDPELLRAGLNDRIHEPYRRQLIAGYDYAKEKALENGAYGMVISGSGSTLLAVGGCSDFTEKMKEAFAQAGLNWQVRKVQPDRNGVTWTIEE